MRAEVRKHNVLYNRFYGGVVKLVHAVFLGLLIVVAYSARVWAADAAFQRFGKLSFDCEQAGTSHQIQVEIDAQNDGPTISFLDSSQRKIEPIRKYLAGPQPTVDRFGQSRWAMTLFSECARLRSIGW